MFLSVLRTVRSAFPDCRFTGPVAGDFMAGLTLVKENIFAVFNLQANGFH